MDSRPEEHEESAARALSGVRIGLIAALDRNGLIGSAGGMPWHLPEDLRWFKRQTQGRTILMGRRTFDSIGRALPRRRNLVMTRQRDFGAPGVEVVRDLAAACAGLGDGDELMVIGGAQIYALALPHAHCLLLTRIEAGYAGDTWFPPVDWPQWRLVDEQAGRRESGAPAYRFMTYERRDG